MSFLRYSGPSYTLILLILLMHVLSSALGKRHLVYWNSTNTRLTGEDFSVEVNLNDYLDILCPYYPSGPPEQGPPETLALYLVTGHQFQGCRETEGAIKRWECNSPYSAYGPVRFSEKIQRFTPFSLGFEFLPGHHYYYSSLSMDDGPPLPCMKLKVTVSSTTTGKKEQGQGTPAPHSFAQSRRTSAVPVLALTSFSLFCFL
ncbi:ephrin-A2 isoform X2 [Tachysurus fulvidraco]|uniref:ephrin-A2 isoform X2 n=1 Tax=Tachysurus fulvidraco TaxID=1234273 RepID=UPI000F508CB8|nr:ephrin-A2 isoform X2 [Tachysurus fulvidraco]